MGVKTHSGTGHSQDKEPFAGSHWWGIVTSSISLTLAMPIQARKSSFALGFFLFMDTSPLPFAPPLEAFKPWGWASPLQKQMLVSDFRIIPFPLHKDFHLLYDFKTPPTAFNLAEDEYLCELLAEVSLMIEQFIKIKPSYPNVKCTFLLLKME